MQAPGYGLDGAGAPLGSWSSLDKARQDLAVFIETRPRAIAGVLAAVLAILLIALGVTAASGPSTKMKLVDTPGGLFREMSGSGVVTLLDISNPDVYLSMIQLNSSSGPVSGLYTWDSGEGSGCVKQTPVRGVITGGEVSLSEVGGSAQPETFSLSRLQRGVPQQFMDALTAFGAAGDAFESCAGQMAGPNT